MKDLPDVVKVLTDHQSGFQGSCVGASGTPCRDGWKASKRRGDGFTEQHRQHVAQMLAVAGLAPHRPVSLGGWCCDICEEPVNGQTDDDGRPLHDGHVVRHSSPTEHH